MVKILYSCMLLLLSVDGSLLEEKNKEEEQTPDERQRGIDRHGRSSSQSSSISQLSLFNTTLPHHQRTTTSDTSLPPKIQRTPAVKDRLASQGIKPPAPATSVPAPPPAPPAATPNNFPASDIPTIYQAKDNLSSTAAGALVALPSRRIFRTQVQNQAPTSGPTMPFYPTSVPTKGPTINSPSTGPTMPFNPTSGPFSVPTSIPTRVPTIYTPSTGPTMHPTFSTGVWVQIGQDIDVDIENYLHSAVAISHNGEVIAVLKGNSTRTAAPRYQYFGNWYTIDGLFSVSNSPSMNLAAGVALNRDGTVIVIGDRLNAGSATILRREPGGEIQSLTDQFYGEEDQGIGTQVALSSSGDCVAVASATDRTSFSVEFQIYRFNQVLRKWIEDPVDRVYPALEEARIPGSWSMSLSADGYTFAISEGRALYSDHNPAGSGKVQVFEYSISNDKWVRRGADISTTGENVAHSVSLNGQYPGPRMAVGYPFPTFGIVGPRNGLVRVYVFNSNMGQWVQKGKDIVGPVNTFGASVSLGADGRVVAIGRGFYDYPEWRGDNYSGIWVYYYEKSSGEWIRVGDGTNDKDEYQLGGESVRLSDDGMRLVLDISREYANGLRSRFARVFELVSSPAPTPVPISLPTSIPTKGPSPAPTVSQPPAIYVTGVWKQLGQDINGHHFQRGIVGAVAISPNGKMIALRGEGHSDETVVTTYELVGEEWNILRVSTSVGTYGRRAANGIALSQDGAVVATVDRGYTCSVSDVFRLNPSDGSLLEDTIGFSCVNFGPARTEVALSLSGNRLAVGIAELHRELRDYRVVVRVYDFDESRQKGWTQVDIDIHSPEAVNITGWGMSMSADGSTVALAVGNYLTSNDGNGETGNVQVYQLENGKWIGHGPTIIKSGEVAHSVALSGDGLRMAVGYPASLVAGVGGARNGIVRMYTFETENDRWVLLGDAIIGQFSEFGGSVSLSSSGYIVAVGSSRFKYDNRFYLNSCDRVGCGRIAVYHFEPTTSTWAQMGEDLYGGDESGDESGVSFHLSGDGTKLVIGAATTSAEGVSSSGGGAHARVYALMIPFTNLNPSPVPTTLPTAGSSNQVYCFSGENTVHVKSKGKISMQDLKLGDEVQIGSNEYSKVYSFGHRHESLPATYLQIYIYDTSISSPPLEISPNHMVFMVGGPGDMYPIPASSLRVGDELHAASLDGRSRTIVKIESVVREGAYAPFTVDGTIIVNGIKASSYIAYQESAVFKLGGSSSTASSFHWLAHTFQFPHRVYCRYISECSTERYDPESGISAWIAFPHIAAEWLMRQNSFVSALLFVPIVVVLGFFALLDSALDHVTN